MKRSWTELADDEDEADGLDEQETEDWSASSSLILSPSLKDALQPLHAISSKFEPQIYSDQNEHKRTIEHVDLDCFYAQVEMIRNPELRTKPLGIQQKNIVVTCNYAARDYGVTKLMYIKDAKEKCPNLVLVSGEDLTHYREYSQRVSDLLQSEFSTLVEKLGFDENFVDVSSLVDDRLKAYQGKPNMEVKGHIFGSENEDVPSQCRCGCHQRLVVGSQIAAEMRERLKVIVGLTGCAGIAWNKLLAKLVGERHKPNDQTTLFPGKEKELMIGLGKARRIPGIGHSMNKKLATLGITTVLELQKASTAELEAVFGQQTTATMKNSSFGIDNSPVNKTGPPQSMSDEDSFKKCSTVPEVMETMANLLEKLSDRLKEDGRVPHTIRLTVRKFSSTQKWHRESRQTSIPNNVTSQISKGVYSISDSLLEVLMGLFNKMVDTRKPFHLTLINICFANFQEKSSAAKSLDTYFAKGKTIQVIKLKNSDIVSDKVGAAALTTEVEKVISHKTNEEKRSSLDIYFKRDKNCDKNVEIKGQKKRSSFFELKSSKVSAAKLSCDHNLGMTVKSIASKDSTLGSYSSKMTVGESDTHTSKGVTVCDSFETNVCETDGKSVQTTGSEIWNKFEKVQSTGIESNTSNLEKGFYPLPGVSREGTIAMDERKIDEISLLDESLPVENVDNSLKTSSSSLEIPPDVDEAIFRSLPPEIQQELLNDWRKKQQSTGSTLDRARQKYQSKQPNTNKRITDFFGKS